MGLVPVHVLSLSKLNLLQECLLSANLVDFNFGVGGVS